MGVGDWEMNGEKALAQGNRNHWIKIIERATQDLHDRVDMQQSVLLSVLGEIKSPPPLELCSTGDCPHRKLFYRLDEPSVIIPLNPPFTIGDDNPNCSLIEKATQCAANLKPGTNSGTIEGNGIKNGPRVGSSFKPSPPFLIELNPRLQACPRYLNKT